ncbi:hypothetical protein [Streptomyces fagopyri]|uniref:hypothetical protein n=1 Tax=Streptomyces fagopyri TaxID=2662397 RepID=UPI00382D7419
MPGDPPQVSHGGTLILDREGLSKLLADDEQWWRIPCWDGVTVVVLMAALS